MKKIFALFAAVLFAGGMMAEGLLIEQTYPGNPSSKVSSYSKSFTLTTNGYTLTYQNINNGSASDSWDAIRAGSKNGASVATITVGPVAEKVSKVLINFTQVDASKTSELYLQVAGDSEFTEPAKINATIAVGEVVFEIAEPAENLHYQVVMDMQKASANGFNRFNKIQFISPDGGTPIVPAVCDTVSVAQALDSTMLLDSMATSKNEFVVRGFVVDAESFIWATGKQIFYLADDAENSKEQRFQAYMCAAKEDGQALPVLNGDEIYLKGYLYKYYNATDSVFVAEIKDGVATFINKVEGDRSRPAPDTIDVARALVIGDSIGQNNTSSGEYVIEGYVTALTDNKGVPTADGGWASYGNQCMWVADSFDAAAVTKETAFFVYQGVAAEQVHIGAKIRFTCAIKNYNGMIENATPKMEVTILENGADPNTFVVPEGYITCAEAVALAADIENPTADQKIVKGAAVKVCGVVVNAFDKKDDGTQSAWIDDKAGEDGLLQGAYLNTEVAVAAGDVVLLEGTLAKYYKTNKDGQFEKIVIEVVDGVMIKASHLGVENVVLTEKAQKIMVDGVIYIVRDGKMFNIQGVRVR